MRRLTADVLSHLGIFATCVALIAFLLVAAVMP